MWLVAILCCAGSWHVLLWPRENIVCSRAPAVDRLVFKVMKGHSAQKGAPFDSPLLSKVTFVGALLTSWNSKRKSRTKEWVLIFLEVGAELPVFTNLYLVQNVKVMVTFYTNRQGWATCFLYSTRWIRDIYLCGVQFYQRATPGISFFPVCKQDWGYPTKSLVLSCNCFNIDHYSCINDNTNAVYSSWFFLQTVLHLDKACLGIHPECCKSVWK